MAHLLYTGANVLYEMLSNGDATGTFGFKSWAEVLRNSSEDSELATNDQLIWLWEALRSAPELRPQFGKLPAVPLNHKDDRFDVFAPGEWFVIGMKSGQVEELVRRAGDSPNRERVSVLTKERLRMRPGKGDRLECCCCQAEVTIHVEEVLPKSREADIRRIEEDRIELADGLLKVHVDSLNQANTVSSRRLEPERCSHGGRTFDQIVHARKGKRTRLEDIRKLVESSSWKILPATPEQQRECVFQEPEQWGLRGDPFLWREIQHHFAARGLPGSVDKFVTCLQSTFEQLVGVSLSTGDESVYVERFAHGGMSSGHIDPTWWRQTAIPLLRDRLARMPHDR